MKDRIQTRRDFLRTAGLCAAGAALSGCAPAKRPTAGIAETPQAQPNILWITCEDTSPHLGCYGDPQAMTPNLDKLASEGTIYTKAFVTAPVCSPVRSCLITGVYATSLGSQHLRSTVPPPASIQPFPKLLRAAGYYCSNNEKEDYNFKDTTIWDESSGAAHWRNRRPGQPFFSVFNFVSTHQGQINGSDDEFFAKYRSKLAPDERHDPETLVLPPYYPETPMVRNIWARYYDLITFMDKQVGDLLAQLDADGLADDTIVFFFADHGLGLPRFKRTLYDSGLHVPLIVRVPARYRSLAPASPGGRIDRLVSTVDLPPTVLTLAGQAVPEHMQGRPFLGPQTAPPRDYVYSASSRVDEAYEMSRCVRDKRYKYIRHFMPHLPYIQPSTFCDQAEIMQELRRIAASGSLTGAQRPLWESTKPVEELYDTQTDPHEMENLADAPAYQATLNRLRKELRNWMLQTKDVGLLPEAEMHIRAAGSTPYEMARRPDRYPQSRILASAMQVGAGPQALPALKTSLTDPDSAVRYWAVVALEALGVEAVPALDAMENALDDPSPNVRFVAAGVLCRLGRGERALPVLTAGLNDPRETVVLHAARTLELLGDKARPAVESMERARRRYVKPDGSYTNNDHAMFIAWALKNAVDHCKP
ncbi:MAG: sulfatase-like hydrolase/transferase [Planctomycetes bacterium]|nr:sulfatase-like hydrolase/transferase [Planctomycetota bacterium]